MVRVVRLGHRIGDGELQLVRPERVGLADARKAEPRAQVQQDRRGLPHDDVPVDKERRREGGTRRIGRTQLAHERRLAAAPRFRLARNVDVFGTGRLEREAHEFSAALDGGPVVKLIRHRAMVAAGRRAGNLARHEKGRKLLRASGLIYGPTPGITNPLKTRMDTNFVPNNSKKYR